ncbi:hypothetical protein FXO38_21820 [Capsicum annuum]|nr:hypothetical protein FXO38_21820 [Capsicum annuum]
MAQHANRRSSVRGNELIDLFSYELPSFSLGLTQDEDFNLGSSNIQPKGGVGSEEVRLKHCNNPRNIVEKMKRKVLRKPLSPKPQKIQKSMKNRKPDEKDEYNKISSLVSFDYESEEEKVEEFERCIMSLETKKSTANAIVIRVKDTNHYFSPKEFSLVTGLNCISNKDDFVFDEDLPNRLIEDYFDGANSGDEEDFVSKKVFDKFRNEIREEMKFIRDLVSTRCDEIMNAISEMKDKECDVEKILNPVEFNVDDSKLNQQNQSLVHIHETLTEERKAEQNLSDSQVTILDEILPSLNAYVNQERSIIVHPSTNEAQETRMRVSRIKRPSRFKESPFTMNFRSAIDSLSSVGHDAGVLAEVEKLAKVIPICLVTCKFYEKKGIDTANHPNYKSYDKMDLSDVYVVEDLPKQPSDSLNCGLYMVTYAECLTFGDLVQSIDFDPDLIRTRYASIL